MANEKRLIDANVLADKLKQHHDFFVNAWGGFQNLPVKDKARVDEITNCIAEVVNAKTVDAVEVVRCKDCKHYFHYGDGVYGCRTFGMTKTEHDTFCSQGQMKDNENP